MKPVFCCIRSAFLEVGSGMWMGSGQHRGFGVPRLVFRKVALGKGFGLLIRAVWLSRPREYRGCRNRLGARYPGRG